MCKKLNTAAKHLLFSLKPKVCLGADEYFASGLHNQPLPHRILPFLTKPISEAEHKFP